MNGMSLLTKNIGDFVLFLSDIIKNRAIIYELTKQDFKTKYLGSYLGLIWAFVNPTITLMIFWFVFQFGFKSKPSAGVPFILWLMSGMVPWFFFSESVSNGMNSVLEKSFLVQKVVFRVSILPIIKILSSLIIHVFFICFLFVMFLCYGFQPHLYNVQVFYYLFAMIVLLQGLSWMTSSLIIFLKDLRAHDRYGDSIRVLVDADILVSRLYPREISILSEAESGILCY